MLNECRGWIGLRRRSPVVGGLCVRSSAFGGVAVRRGGGVNLLSGGEIACFLGGVCELRV